MDARGGAKGEGSPGPERGGSVPPGVPPALAVAGPTATGKTELAVRLCERLEGEIVSFDSRQAYRGMEVGTAAPGPDMRRRVPHHGVGFLEPGEPYGAGRFARLARGWIRGIRARGKLPVLVGGTGLFLGALLDPVFREPPMDPGRRSRLRRHLADLPPERLRAWTRRLDPELEGSLDELDPQRCARSVELALLSGRPLTWWQRRGVPEAPPLPALVISLELGREEHRRRIRARARRMLAGGWIEEVRILRAEGHGPGTPAFEALGYRAVDAVARGELEREEALERIFRETWQYARRQRTWFRHQLPEDALRLDAARPPEDRVKEIVRAWERRPATRTASRGGRGPTGEGSGEARDRDRDGTGEDG